jgi:hypothetical protein
VASDCTKISDENLSIRNSRADAVAGRVNSSNASTAGQSSESRHDLRTVLLSALILSIAMRLRAG